MVRRSIFVALTFTLMEYVAIQVQIHLLMSLAYVMYMTSVPEYRTSLLRDSELFNEWALLVCSYHITLFTNELEYSSEFSSLAEYTMIITVLLLLGVNALIIMRAVIQQGMRMYKLKTYKKKQDKILSEREDAIDSLKKQVKLKANEHSLGRRERRKTIVYFSNQID